MNFNPFLKPPGLSCKEDRNPFLVLGVVKSLFHYAVGDTKGGNRALKAAFGIESEPSTGEHAGIPDNDDAASVSTDNSQEYVPTKKSQEYVPTKKPQENVPTKKPQEYVPTKNPQENVPTKKPQENVPTKKPQENVPTKKPQENVPTKNPQENVPTKKPQENVPTKKPQENVPTKHPQENVPIKKPQKYVPTNKSRKYVPTLKEMSNPFINPEIFGLEENALLSDSYVDATVTDDNKKIKRILLNERLNQKPGVLPLRKPYKIFATREDLKKLNRGFQQDKSDINWKSPSNNYAWLYVKMPIEFNYTGVVKLNHPIEGLLHNIIRHSDQWQHYIPCVNDLLKTMSDLEDELKHIRAANNANNSINAIKKFLVARIDLSHDKYIAAREADLHVQMDLHEFIQENITYKKYRGEGVNINGKEQVFFKVRNNLGESQVMVVCLSDQLFPVNAAFPDGRPIRIITSIFFTDWKDYFRRHVMKKF